MVTSLDRQIKGYKLSEEIAQGGFGTVYRAFQSAVNREVAIKVINPHLANQPEFIRRFEAEAQIIARLEHPFIVPLHDYWRDPDGAYLVMRYLGGGSLADHIRKNGHLNIEEAINILSQITQALHVAHRNQIVHRDIKPSNLLLDEDGNGYLSDFGIAKDHATSQSITEPDSFIGSPEYLAPEQALSEPVTPQTDIYSLGIVLYEILEGQHPFPRVDKITYIYKHLNDPIPHVTTLDDEISVSVNEVIQKATAKAPKHRFQSVIDMMQALHEAAQLDMTPTSASLVELLTPREQEVMQLIIAGKTNREIADALVLAESTIKSYINSIYRKLNVRSRVQAIARARDLEFVIQKPKTNTSTGHLPEPENPYKGLQSFNAADANNFYGRQKLINKLLKRLEESEEYHRFLAVVGPSGSGKSSVVKAGLVPALWRGDLAGSEKWYIAEMLPGDRPLDELEVALYHVAGAQNLDLREQLQRDERGLVRAADMLLPDDDSELLVVIDQFEEVFTLVDDENCRQHFLNLLYAVATNRRSRVRVIVTLRADYYDRPLQYADFGDLIRDRVETVLPLNAEELAQAISEPANHQGVTFEDGLVSRIVSDVHYQPGALPLLQYALTELFEHRTGRKLTLAAYQGIGGTGGALANRADEIYTELDEDGHEMIRQLFLRLVTLGEGAEDTRRRVTQSELLELTDNRDLMNEVIDLYATSRLLSLDNDPSTRQPTVEVAHEAILREWDRLRQWLNQSRQDIRQQRTIAQVANAWYENQRDTSYLLTGSRLDAAIQWQKQTELALTPLEKEFINISIAMSEAQEEAEEQRKAREDALERRSQTILRTLVGVFALATVLSIGLSIFAMTSRNEAARERDNAQENFLRAEQIRLAAQAQIALDRGEDVRIPALLALRSLEIGYSPEADGALLQALSRTFSRQTYVGHTGDGTTGVAFVHDTDRVLTSSTDGTARLWDMLSGEQLNRYVGHQGTINRLVVCPGQSTFLTAGNDGTIRLWDIESGNEIEILFAGEAPIRNLAISPDGHLLAASIDDRVMVWSLEDMTLRYELAGHTDLVNSMKFSPNSTVLATPSQDSTVRLWNMQTGEEIRSFEGHAAGVWDVDFSPDGLRIVSASLDQTARIWDVGTGDEVGLLIGHRAGIQNIAYSPDGRTIATSGPSELGLFLWDAESGQLIRQLEGHTSGVTVIDFSPDGNYLISGSLDSVPRLWVVEDETEPRAFALELDTAHANTVQAITLSDNNQYLVTVSNNGVVRTWDVNRQSRVNNLVIEQESAIAAAAISHSQRAILAGTNTGEIGLWDAETGELLGELFGHSGGITSIKFDTSDDFFITGSEDNLAILWRTDTQTPLMTFDGHTESITDVAVSQEHGVAVTASEDGSAIVWNTETGTQLHHFEGNGAIVLSVALSPDGQYLLTGCDDNTAQLWDIQSGEMLQQFIGHTGVIETVAFSHDGQVVITGSRDATARMWDAASGEIMRQFVGHESPLSTLFVPEDPRYFVTGDQSGAYMWHSQLDDIIDLSCEKIVLDLSLEERDLYQINDDYEICDVISIAES